MTQIRFGTDGWRGRVAEDYTFDSVRRCAQGFAAYMIETGKCSEKIVVGHDKRFSGEYFAAAVAEVLAANKLQVLLTDGAAPTPVISYAVLAQGAAGAVNVTASHNPPTDNGFKVLTAKNGKKGIKLFKERSDDIDIVILDYIMPDISGRDVLKRLKEIKENVKVLVASGYSKNGQAKEMMDDNADGFIQKPSTLSELIRTIRSILDR